MDSNLFATALHWLDVIRGLLNGVNATVLGYALLAALGASLIVANLSLFGEIHLLGICNTVPFESVVLSNDGHEDRRRHRHQHHLDLRSIVD